MRYVMKQKLLAWGDDFTIKDENGQDRFYVDGKVLSFGDKLSFQDMAGNELAFISQKLLSWGPTYELWRGGRLFAIVKKHLWTMLNYRFSVDVNADGPGPEDLEIEGDFWAHEYTFTRGGRAVAQVSKQWFAWADTYGVDVLPAEDDVLVLACTVIVDLVTQQHKNKD
jgi:uncharacterized protein YxjI